MGQSTSSRSSSDDITIYIHGFQESGKTSILEKFQAGGSKFAEYKETNVKNVSMVNWGLGGREYSRHLAIYMYKQGVDAMLIVVNSVDEYYTALIADFLKELLEEESLKDAIFLVLANKQDMDKARSVEEVAKELDFYNVTKSHVANIMGCSAKTGEGLQEAMDWLVKGLEAKKESVYVEKQEKKSRSFISCVKGGLHAMKSMVKRS